MATPGGTPNQAKKPHTKTPAKTPAKQKVKKANAPKTPGSRKGFGNHGWKHEIMAMSLEDLPRIIRDYDTTERAEHQHDLIASCLKRILRDLKLNSNHEPREE
ncbi:hypothetical protein PMAA_082070 [Talaromyces marneffei ATCC 18224]|uniref:Uncharacterized protein n=1 Tax=Talaromyces marneffei (strain ATCC 18224 / CBS 334.59 / QM 7333) TaxID=441960 RepID=B6QFG6_TALMQ|nr:hypothetical protein PMAA_082070 [Talaromyces marneffei ATCC 18224]